MEDKDNQGKHASAIYTGERKLYFLTGGKWNETIGRRLLGAHNASGLPFEDLIRRFEKEGKSCREWHNKFLRSHFVDIHFQLMKNPSLNDLAGLNIIISEKIKELTDRLNNAVDPLIPASFVECYKVEEADGSSYMINEGLEEEIAKGYETAITSLNQALTIVKARIEKLKMNFSSTAEDELTDTRKGAEVKSIWGLVDKQITILLKGVHNDDHQLAKSAFKGNDAIFRVTGHMFIRALGRMRMARLINCTEDELSHFVSKSTLKKDGEKWSEKTIKKYLRSAGPLDRPFEEVLE